MNGVTLRASTSPRAGPHFTNFLWMFFVAAEVGQKKKNESREGECVFVFTCALFFCGGGGGLFYTVCPECR